MASFIFFVLMHFCPWVLLKHCKAEPFFVLISKAVYGFLYLLRSYALLPLGVAQTLNKYKLISRHIFFGFVEFEVASAVQSAIKPIKNRGVTLSLIGCGKYDFIHLYLQNQRMLYNDLLELVTTGICCLYLWNFCQMGICSSSVLLLLQFISGVKLKPKLQRQLFYFSSLKILSANRC
ncbi:uncharacterized protein LOC133880196 [Alnus glutinosa]|uniref:uncharacterized protein LOC133880196 n=1 Tax=Alnus glutinosa TaxID=3517 RepID=UPI002D76C958|nr:uncharacterized protein LOC133880196 [Alnus glutinosa]